jgi:hypothetical protein
MQLCGSMLQKKTYRSFPDAVLLLRSDVTADDGQITGA